MDQEILYFEANTAIKEDLSAIPYVRHYMQEQSFTSNSKENLKVDLPFNHLINKIVNELSILNKLIATNSKLTSSLLENGRDIFMKKQEYFDNFLNEYLIIRDTLHCMSPPYRMVFEYSVMALSNLILKLSINMAKISIIVVTKLATPAYLNLFTTSILFEKYLEQQIVRNKKISTPQEHKLFLKQFPKISVVKICKKRNPYDVQYIRKSQSTFNSFKSNEKSQLLPDISNIQWIELYENDAENILMTKYLKRYQNCQSFNLKEMFGLSAPFGFELYLIISQIIIAKMLDFRPDIIIYIQDFDYDQISINPKVRGLILNQFSEKIQNKIYVFKQFGLTQKLKDEWRKDKGEVFIPQFDPDFCQKIYSQISIQTDDSFVTTCDKHQDRMISIKRFMQQGNRITEDTFKRMQQWLKIEYRKNTIFEVKNLKQSDKIFANYIKILHSNIFEDLTYASLALIQKFNFDQTIKQYRNYHFPTNFLDKTIRWIQKQIIILENQKFFHQFKDYYKNTIDKLNGMKQLTLFGKNINQRQVTQFFNFLNNRTEKLEFMINKQILPIKISKEDSFYIAYIDHFIIIFLFRTQNFHIYRKTKKQQWFTLAKSGQYFGKNLNLGKKHSTLVANKRYFYKAFGQARDPSQNLQSQIFRINIEKPQLISQKSQWQKLQPVCTQISYQKQTLKKSAKIPLEFKRYGYGYSFQTQQNQKNINITLFGGGFNFKIQNEQKINRFFYIIKDNSKQILKIGKTNPCLVNQSQNMRAKTILYPFVYGIPLITSDNLLSIINTNGYLENINHFKRLFLTKLKIGPLNGQQNSISGIGIIAQNKMQYPKPCPQVAMANKNTILSYLIESYNKINRFNNRLSLYNSEGQLYLLSFQNQNINEPIDLIKVSPVNSKQMTEIEQNIQITFSSKKMIPK